MRSASSSPRQIGAVAAGAGVILVFAAIVLLGAFKAVAPSDVCVVQEGGPLDGRGISEVRQPSGGVSFIGVFNSQHCFPATQRNYVISPDPAHREQGETLDFFETPTSDAVQVRIEGQALFSFNTDPDVVKSFYTKYGVRTFDGLHPYEGSEGWASFLSVQFRPVLDNALREAIGKYRCVELNNTCAYVQDSAAVATGKVDVNRDNSQNLSKVQAEIGTTLEADLKATLGGPFFENVQFRLVQVRFDEKVQESITAATAARADVATKRLQAQQRVETAIGERRAADQKARAINATRRAYRQNPAQARIDGIRALPDGLQALGGNLSAIVGGGASEARRRPRLHRRRRGDRVRPADGLARRARAARRAVAGRHRRAPRRLARRRAAARRDQHARTVRELPGDMDAIELAAELRLAREDAQLQADELNR